MMARAQIVAMALVAAMVCPPVLAASPETKPETKTGAEAAPVEDITYLGVETRMLDAELVDLRVALKGTETDAAVAAYLKCAAAQYTLIRGMDTARQIRTVVSKSGGTWRGQAVYMIGKGNPRGFDKVEARAMMNECAEKNIPAI
ncbi:MAG TPA: hypothetical protein VGC40_07505 [Paenirhodobacter sp.]